MLGKILFSVIALAIVPWAVTVGLARIAGVMVAVQGKPPSALSGLEPVIKDYAVVLIPMIVLELAVFFVDQNGNFGYNMSLA